MYASEGEGVIEKHTKYGRLHEFYSINHKHTMGGGDFMYTLYGPPLPCSM